MLSLLLGLASALHWHIVSQLYPDTLFPSITLTHCFQTLPWHIVSQHYLIHCFPALPWYIVSQHYPGIFTERYPYILLPALPRHIVFQHYPDTLFPSLTLTHCLPALPWHIVSQRYRDTLFPSVTLTHCFLVLPWHIVSQLHPDTLFPSITLTHCSPALPWHIVSQRYPYILFPIITLTLCFPTRFLQNVVRSSTRSRGINKKILKYSSVFQTCLQKSREILSGNWQCWFTPRALRTIFMFCLDQYAVQVVVICEVSWFIARGSCEVNNYFRGWVQTTWHRTSSGSSRLFMLYLLLLLFQVAGNKIEMCLQNQCGYETFVRPDFFSKAPNCNTAIFDVVSNTVLGFSLPFYCWNASR